MHSSAQRIGLKFLSLYGPEHGAKILEIGSRDVNGSLRAGMPPDSIWTGVDIESGVGVDVVIESSTRLPFDSGVFDLVIASSVFEHDLHWWKTLGEMSRVLKETGYVYINAPSNGPFHRFPIDSFRFYPDASIAMLQVMKESHTPMACLEESFIVEQDPRGGVWNDFVCVISGGPNAQAPIHRIHHSENCTNVWSEGSFLEDTFREVPEDGRVSTLLRISQEQSIVLENRIKSMEQSLSWRATKILRLLVSPLAQILTAFRNGKSL